MLTCSLPIIPAIEGYYDRPAAIGNHCWIACLMLKNAPVALTAMIRCRVFGAVEILFGGARYWLC
jgi:hypothetical protein